MTLFARWASVRTSAHIYAPRDMSWTRHSHLPVREGSADIPLDSVMQNATYQLLRIYLLGTWVNKGEKKDRSSTKKESERPLVEYDRLTGLSCQLGSRAPEAVPLVEPPNALVVCVRPQLDPLETACPRLRKRGSEELTAYALARALGGDEHHLHDRHFGRARARWRYQDHAHDLTDCVGYQLKRTLPTRVTAYPLHRDGRRRSVASGALGSPP